MKEFDLPDVIRDQLGMVGQTIYWGISPDLIDGLSDIEMDLLRQSGPAFFKLLENRGLPEGFSNHFKDEVLRDMIKVRENPAARVALRRELERLLADPKAMDRLYRANGPTFSGMLRDAANHANVGMFRKPSLPGWRGRSK